MSRPQDVAATADSGRGAALDATTDLGASRLSDTIDHGQFVPGTVVAGRYRIVGRLGRGGMGEVYRADDLKLGQPVALKFLPPALAKHSGRIERFHNEVRIARQVSHANVCRVYDIGEVEGQPYLSMEYVDGEDLASLLRRIDRLPGDKAVQIARQLCAGLAAAHERNVLHRDLKPANVMIDGRGRVRITDFGLAGLAEELRGAEIRAGTPAYMSPEQLAGREVTARSDIFSLGLVLYEMFTGKAAYQASSLTELMQVRDETNPSSPSTHVPDLDPAVERVILRCLERDPRYRPQSALAVAAALPGANPLAAALAAGETPSPELVAAAGVTGTVRLRAALAGGVLLLLGMVAVMWSAGQTYLVNRVALPKPHAVLAEKAREVLSRLGYAAPPVDEAYGFAVDRERLSFSTKDPTATPRWAELGRWPAPIHFWYRQSPRHLVPKDVLFSMGVVSADDPPQLVSGMASVELDSAGRLLAFSAVPLQREDETPTSSAPDWSTLIAAAGLEDAALEPAAPQWLPPVYADRREAWTGVRPGLDGVPIRVEAAACRGRPVYFQVVWPWTRPKQQEQPALSTSAKLANYVALIVVLLVFPAGMYMARRNLRLGRGDRRGAWRCAAFVFGTRLLGWLLTADHVPEFGKGMVMFVAAFAHGTYLAVMVWIFYVALEPYVRRLWPDTIISWSRVLSGQWRDPLVGRDVMIGVLAGLAYGFAAQLAVLIPILLTVPGAPPLTPPGSAGLLEGARAAIGDLLLLATFAVFIAMFQVVLLLLLRTVLRNGFAAGATFALFGTAAALTQANNLWIEGLVALAANSLAVLVIMRCGLLAWLVSFFVQLVLVTFPLTLDTGAWYFGVGVAAPLVILALAAFGARQALAGDPFAGVRSAAPSAA